MAIRSIDPINASCRLGLARVHSRRGEHRKALDQAIAAAGLVHDQPQAHFLCARSLSALGRQAEAIISLQVALEQNPVFPAAHLLMARLQRQIGNLEEAREHRLLARASLERLRAIRRGDRMPRDTDLDRDLDVLLQQPITLVDFSNHQALPPIGAATVVVSGLPRSGTSMVMQMLAAGGLELLSDTKRGADANNPRGYLEYEPVKSLGRTPAVHWIEKTRGKAVKVVAPLLIHLPAGRPYRIVFVERPLVEVLASQAAMLECSGQSTTPRSQRHLAAAYLQQNQRLQVQLQASGPSVQVLSLPYHDAISDPVKTAARLNRFLGGELDETAMAAAIDPQLHRQRGDSVSIAPPGSDDQAADGGAALSTLA